MRTAGDGFSLVETALALALAGLLAGWAGQGGRPSPAVLDAVQGELRAGLDQAFLLARARGGTVRVALDAARPRPGPGAPAPLVLPRGVRWGLAAGIPLPEGMERTVRAHRVGYAHAATALSPRGTAQAGAWFLTDGRDAVCLRLDGRGRLRLLRWRRRAPGWRRA